MMKKVLLASVSGLALREFWAQDKSISHNTTSLKQRTQTTFDLAVLSIESQLRFCRSQLNLQTQFGFVSDIVYTHHLQEIEKYGYVRIMDETDVIKGSCAQAGWYGFFASDGDIVFWDDECTSCIWDVSGVLVFFQKYLN